MVKLLGLYTSVLLILAYASKSDFVMVLASLYFFAFIVGLLSLYKIHVKEKKLHLDNPETILIVAPHQDDCVISSGGLGIRNLRLGGETHIAYITQERSRDMAETRTSEAIESWRLAGCTHLYHMDLLPARNERNPEKIYEAAKQLQSLIDEIKPTVLLVPLFEGGHVQHDITNFVVSFLIRKPDGLRIYECPEYSPYFSFFHTPHKVLGILSRFFLVFVSYFGPPEALDGRTIFVLDLSDEELECKKQMLKSFSSQGGNSLANGYGYPDRVIEWVERPYRASPYRYGGSLSHILQILRGTPVEWLAKRLFPWEYKSVGRERGITNLDEELVLKK